MCDQDMTNKRSPLQEEIDSLKDQIVSLEGQLRDAESEIEWHENSRESIIKEAYDSGFSEGEDSLHDKIIDATDTERAYLLDQLNREIDIFITMYERNKEQDHSLAYLQNSVRKSDWFDGTEDFWCNLAGELLR